MAKCKTQAKKRFNAMNNECRNCEFTDECQDSNLSIASFAELKENVKKEFVAFSGELTTYSLCMSFINSVIFSYSDKGGKWRRKDGFKERKKALTGEIKHLSKIPDCQEKLDLLMSYAEYIYFGIHS